MMVSPRVSVTSPSVTVSTRQRILDATVEALDRGGEAAVRVTDVADAAGVTQGMVTYHFRTRDRLVAEAHSVRFVESVRDDMNLLELAVGSTHTAADMRFLVSTLTTVLLSPDRVEARRRRLSAVGFAIQSEIAFEVMSEAHSAMIDAFERLVSEGQRLGVLRPEVDARATASVLSAYAFGLVLLDFDRDRPSDDALRTTIDVLLGGLLTDT